MIRMSIRASIAAALLVAIGGGACTSAEAQRPVPKKHYEEVIKCEWYAPDPSRPAIVESRNCVVMRVPIHGKSR